MMPEDLINTLDTKKKELRLYPRIRSQAVVLETANLWPSHTQIRQAHTC